MTTITQKHKNMKSTILTIMLAALTMGAAAQSKDSTCVRKDSVRIFSDPESSPHFRGGKEGLMQFLKKNVKYPEAAEAYGVEGRVIMSFIINEDGSLSDITAHNCKIERFNTTKFSQETETRQKALKEQFAKLFAKEGVRVIRKMPKGAPGKINGKAQRTKMSLPIKFSIPDK